MQLIFFNFHHHIVIIIRRKYTYIVCRRYLYGHYILFSFEKTKI